MQALAPGVEAEWSFSRFGWTVNHSGRFESSSPHRYKCREKIKCVLTIFSHADFLFGVSISDLMRKIEKFPKQKKIVNSSEVKWTQTFRVLQAAQRFTPIGSSPLHFHSVSHTSTHLLDGRHLTANKQFEMNEKGPN